MEAVVVDAGSKLLKACFAAPDQDPPLIIPGKMKRVVEDGELAADGCEGFEVDPVVRGFVNDWDAMICCIMSCTLASDRKLETKSRFFLPIHSLLQRSPDETSSGVLLHLIFTSQCACYVRLTMIWSCLIVVIHLIN